MSNHSQSEVRYGRGTLLKIYIGSVFLSVLCALLVKHLSHPYAVDHTNQAERDSSVRKWQPVPQIDPAIP